MVKGAVIILLLGFAVVFGAYYFGGVSSWDPEEEGRAAKAALSPGMSWTAVVDAAGEPGHYQYVRQEKSKDLFGMETIKYVPGYKQEFDYNAVSDALNNNEFPHGFLLHYFFSHQIAFRAWFDSSGTLERVEDVMTMADLLKTREP
jgi:hypothetical protein